MTSDATPKLLSELWHQYKLRRMASSSTGTFRLHEFGLRRFNEFLGRPATLDDLNDDTVSAFVAWRRQTVAPTTINRDLAVILALWRWAHRQRLIDAWPDVQQVPEPVRAPVAWTEQQFNRLIATILRREGMVGEYSACDWWLALLLTILETGERIGAVMQLTWDNVDLERRFIRFPAETRKGKRRDHVLEISDETVAALDVLRTIPGLGKQRTRGVVFPWPYARETLWLHFGRIVSDAGLPNDRRRKFHCIRRTTASHYEASGGDAGRLLGHSDRRVTECYLDPQIATVEPAYRRIFRPNLKPSLPARPAESRGNKSNRYTDNGDSKPEEVSAGQRVLAVMHTLRVSRAEMARRLGISRAGVDTFLGRRNRNPRRDTIERWAAALGVEPDVLTGKPLPQWRKPKPGTNTEGESHG